MDFSYKKNNNSSLFTALAKEDLINASNAQNYIPLYSKFFSLTDSNYNNINLNNTLSLYDINDKISNNIFNCKLIDNSGIIISKPVFYKFSPLLDPVKYIVGKYDISNSSLLNLPKYNSKDSHAKIRDINNAAYVDGFFTYLTSQLLHNHNFIHSLDFYGSFLATKNDFSVDVTEDLEYINKSEFFHQNKDNLFKLENGFYSELMNFDTRNYKEKLSFDTDILPNNVLNLSDISDLSEFDALFKKQEQEQNQEQEQDQKQEQKQDQKQEQEQEKDQKQEQKCIQLCDAELLFVCDNSGNQRSACSTTSNCSSRSSNTDNESSDCDDNDNKDTLSQMDSEYSGSSCSMATEDSVFATISKFPVQIISLEKCEKTLDSLLINHEFSNKELGSIIIQILMILITFQKTFGLTHNDLHTNNIMYVSTEKQYLYYRVDGKHYKVPTFGRIFKIIDFGRAIYKFRGTVICSDSFHSKGDAATQYNFEPYFNKNKPRLEPNFSFDLCRLGCSLFDFIVDDISEIKNVTSSIEKIILEWCVDDKNRNVMYKNNGEERYPEFKLYKMIARTVHKHIPIDVLRKPYFENFVVSKKKINKTGKIINIDNLPSYMC